MMKSLIQLFAVTTLMMSILLQPTIAKDASAISKDTALKAIGAFRSDPASPAAMPAARLVKEFAETSGDVRVIITKKAVPLISHHELPLSETGPLTAAFLVGNVRSQLLHHRIGDDAYAGGLQVIETYRQLQKKNSRLRISEIEKFVELERAGKLKAYLSAP
jgi:hypothetical protein